jgi:putative NADPH-quinone reductase
MNVLIVLGHPDENSFNHAIAETCWQKLTENGHSVIFHDLHKENFDPILPTSEIVKNGYVDEAIQKQCDELASVDGIIVVHPNWWGQPPAILKGWVDRIIRQGVAYKFGVNDKGEGVPIGLLKAQIALVFNTSNTEEKREIEVFNDPLQTLWKNCIFDFCGVPQFDRKMFRIIITSTPEQRQQWLNETETMIDQYFPSV